MSQRAHQRDTPADKQVYECLNATPPRSFMMIAGAGSGKTTSLIKALTEILSRHGDRLRLKRQRVACITYTEIAAGEIWADVGNNPLVHVSTIHSFLWVLVRPFQQDIQQWVASRIEEKIADARATAAAFGPRVQQRTRDKNASDIARYEQQQTKIGRVNSFRYGTGSDYPKGILGHDDIIRMVPGLLSERKLMRTLVRQQYPFIFVDESQDTAENVVTALKAVDVDPGRELCLGFFGDPMQRIYPTGIGAISLSEGWADITKPENFRCPTAVLRVANAIRRDGDALVQTRGRMIEKDGELRSVAGSAHLFIVRVDEQRDRKIAQVRSWAATTQNDPGWLREEDVRGVKVLVIVHRMAAKRLGFESLYAALNDKAPDVFKNGFLDGTAWPVRSFHNFVMPLAIAMQESEDFEVMKLLRGKSNVLSKEKLLGIDVAKKLAEVRTIIESLRDMMAPASMATTADVFRALHSSKLLELDPRILSYLKLKPNEVAAKDPKGETVEEEEDTDELTKEVASMDAFLKCRASEFWGYFQYVNEESPFSTQQGIKGTEFERVLVILDDDEGTHTQFSYDKYLGIKALSDRDQTNIADGKETAVERTRRLFYVCCTRALKDLVVVLFTEDVQLAQRQVAALNLFPAESIHQENELGL